MDNVNPSNTEYNAMDNAGSRPNGQRQASEELKRKSAEIGEEFQNLGKRVSSAAQESLGHIKENATAYLRRGKERAQYLEQNMETQIHQHPLVSILLAALVGMILGALMKRQT